MVFYKAKNNPYDEYIRMSEALFPIMGRQEKAFIEYKKKCIIDWFQSYRDVCIDDIVAVFGEPNRIVREYFESICIEPVLRRIAVNRIIRSLVFVLTIVISVIVISVELERMVVSNATSNVNNILTNVYEVDDSGNLKWKNDEFIFDMPINDIDHIITED